jgi:hypothetical protein
MSITTRKRTALSPERDLSSPEFLSRTVTADSEHMGQGFPARECAPPDSQSSETPFAELSRASAIRIATAVTRPTIVASSG